MAHDTRSIQFGATTIPFALHRSQSRRTAAITVEPSSRVLIVTPTNCSEEKAAAAVRRKAAWILRQWDEQQHRSKSVRREFVGGETFLYLGRGFKLVIDDCGPKGAKLVGGTLRVCLGWDCIYERDTKNYIHELLVEWYKTRGEIYMTQLVNEYAAMIHVDPPPVKVTDIATRWGSCTSGGIRFDWRIMMATRRLVRYVAAHEVCHLRHANHSKAFWRLVERVMPDYAVRHAELSTIGPRLSF